MKFAHVENERLLGWYSPDVHTNIPSASFEVSDAVWQTALNINANAYVDGKFVRKDFSTPEQVTQRRVNELKILLIETDHKVLPDYDRPDPQLRQQRQAWRNEIRQLNGDI